MGHSAATYVRKTPANCLIRGDLPYRTPIVRGRIRRPAKLVATDQAGIHTELQRPENQEAAHRAMTRASCAFFASEYLSGPDTEPYNGRFLIGRHHLAWDRLLAKHRRICSLAPRDHGKSHWWSLAFPIWMGGWREPGSTGYIFSASQDLAEDFLAKIKDELLGNQRLRHLVPPNADRIWTKREIVLANGTKIRARGWGVKVRGGHPEWIVCDDVLDDTSLYSETKRQRAIDYFFSVPTNMVIPKGYLIVVGTPFHHADLYAQIKKRKAYAYTVYPCRDADGRPLFPQRYSVQGLKDKEDEIDNPALFAREFMCRPLSDEASLFPSKLFAGEARVPYKLGLPASYWEAKGWPRYAGVDVAMDAEIGRNWFVIFVIALDEFGNRWIVDIIRERKLSFQAMLDLTKEAHAKYQIDAIYVEANQAQRWLSDELMRTTSLPIKRWWTSGVQPKQPWKKGMTSLTMGKHSLDRGVPSLRMGFENGKWRIPRGDAYAIEMTDTWIGEMGSISYENGKVLSVGEHDDTTMACWMADIGARFGAESFEFVGAEPVKYNPHRPPVPPEIRERAHLMEEMVTEFERLDEESSEESFDPFGLGDYSDP